MAGHVVERAFHTARPRVTITAPPTSGVIVERDVPVVVRDGTTLRVDVYRPEAPGPHPVILSHHVYGKSSTPFAKAKQGRNGTTYPTPPQYRLLRQTEPITHSAWTGWEAPDPAVWVPNGYVVINADLRGWGTSDGVGELFSEQEAQDGHDLVEWAGTQPWSTGKVGLAGVSYLAISQWGTAAQRPPHLAAIAPWEGLTDLYRDHARPGGIREDGFMRIWAAELKRERRSPVTLRKEVGRRELWDRWWADRCRDLEAIEVPALVCGSFSDHCLHSRGSFEGFRRISSTQKWLYTHRGPKWSAFYAPEAVAFQQRFFDHFLKGEDNGMDQVPPVRLEVRSDARTVTSVREVEAWPPPGTTWTPLYLAAGTSDADADEHEPHPGTLALRSPATEAHTSFATKGGRSSFTFTFREATEVVGAMRVRLFVEVRDEDDASLFVGVRKLRRGREVGFEGSYGFDRDLVTHGMLQVSLREVDEDGSLPWAPFHPYTSRRPVHAREVVPVEVELLPSATLFEKGSQLRLDVQGRWFFPTNPLTGQVPARYRHGPEATVLLRTGGTSDAALFVPTTTPLT
jgi:predicted acyl esterase